MLKAHHDVRQRARLLLRERVRSRSILHQDMLGRRVRELSAGK